MPMMRPLLACLLLVCLRATNDIDLVEFQTNLTVVNNTSVASISYTADGTLLVAAANETVSFFKKNSSGSFDATYKVPIGYPIVQAVVKGDGSHVAVAALYYLFILSNSNGNTSNYVIAQVIYVGKVATSVTWAANGERLIVGLNNGSLIVFGRYSTNQYERRQFFNTTHPSIAKISGAKSRFAVCSRVDPKLTIFYYNTTDGMYSVNQTIEQLAGGGCTSLDFSPLENRIASGRTDGTVAILRRDANFNYAVSNKLIASHALNVSFVKWSGDSVYLLVGVSVNNTVDLWSAANNFASPIANKPINGQYADFSMINQAFAIGAYDTGSVINIYILDVSNCENTITDNSSVCTCLSDRIWQNGNCSTLDCSNLLNSPGTASNSSICGCNDGFVYNSTLMECQRSCPDVANSNGSNYEYSSCFCVKGYQWWYAQSRCRIICVGMVGSSGENVDDTTCVCNAGFIWNGSLCGLNCSNILNSNDRRISPNCSCKAGLVWNASAIACWTSCTKVIGSNGTNMNSTSCHCMQSFYWDSTTSFCLINCTSAPNSDGTNTTVSSCNCKNGFVWNSNMSACSVDCTNLAHSNNTNDGLNSCFCYKDYIYVKGVCEAMINCTGLLNSPGTNFNQTWCNCNEGYIFWPSQLDANESVCQLNCSQFTRANLSRSTGRHQTCTCIMGYTWAGNKCLLTCGTMKYGKQATESDTVCSCHEGYQWDQIIGQCIVSSGSNAQEVALGLGISFGVLLLIGLAVMFACYWKKRKSTMGRIALVSSRPLQTSAVLRRSGASQSETNINRYQSTLVLESPEKRIPQPSDSIQQPASSSIYPPGSNIHSSSNQRMSQSRAGAVANNPVSIQSYNKRYNNGNQEPYNAYLDHKNQWATPTEGPYKFFGDQINARVGSSGQAAPRTN